MRNKEIKRILITGSSGFIGFHLAKLLIEKNFNVLGIDNFSDYYDVMLKEERTNLLLKEKNFNFLKNDIKDKEFVNSAFKEFNPDVVIHLAAQAGVRYSLESPESYIDTNILGTFNVMESLKQLKCKHFLVASTSSIYSENNQIPFSEKSTTDFPTSLYAATKKSTEVLVHSYSHLHNIPTTCFRFFTVYGPWGRPDMALFKFTKSIIEETPISVHDNGNMMRDFTYIDDLVLAVFLLIKKPPKKNIKKQHTDTAQHNSYVAPWRTVNIGSSNPIKLNDLIEKLEKALGKKAIKKYVKSVPGELARTYADVSALEKLTGFKPSTKLEIGVDNFVNWYKKYKKVQ